MNWNMVIVLGIGGACGFILDTFTECKSPAIYYNLGIFVMCVAEIFK